VGKTRLVVEVAHRYVDQTGADACFVDLTKVASEERVPELVARELGIHLEHGGQTERAIEEALRDRSILIVLDNFEHLIEATGVVGHLVQCSAGVKVLSTSRARLRVAGEHLFDVPPLSVEPPHNETGDGTGVGDAVALFEQAAQAVDPQFQLAPHLADVVDICRSVDGLPLAVELAAAQVRTLPPPLLRSRLNQRLGSQGASTRDSPTRQQTIVATIDWSLQLLTADEHQLFVCLGVFAGPVPLNAIEAVCAAPGHDLVDVLSRLVDQSLVRRLTTPDGDARFTLLELMRRRARDLLGGDEEVDLRTRHARYYATLLDQIDAARGEARLAAVETMMTEIRIAHAWADQRGETNLAASITAGMAAYWHRHGGHVEGRRWVAAALANQEKMDDRRLVTRLHLAAGTVEWPRDRLVARRHWSKAIEGFRELGDDAYLSYTLALTSVTYIGDAEDYQAALALCDQGISLARAVGDPRLTARALNMKGELARVHGDDELALAAYDEGRRIAEEDGDLATLGIFLGNLAFLADHRGDYHEAGRLSHEALRLSWAHGRRMAAAWLLTELAGVALGLGRPELGAQLIGASDQALNLLDVDRHPCDVPEYERVVTGLASTLSPDKLGTLLSDGKRLTLDEAVALALTTSPGEEPT
jgi:predicted ATPase